MKKGFLKKLGTIVLGAFMAVNTIGFTVGLTACNFDDDNDHEIVTPVPDPEPDDPIIDPDDPSIEDPDDGKEDPEQPVFRCFLQRSTGGHGERNAGFPG